MSRVVWTDALRGLMVSVLLLSTMRVAAQQVVGHVPLLPAEAGLNPLGVDLVAVDPVNPDVFVLSGRGVTALDRGAVKGFVNYSLGPKTQTVPQDLVFDSTTRRLWVSDSGQRALFVIDGGLRTVLARIPLAFAPGPIAFDPTLRRVYVLARSGPEVAAIDAPSLTVVATAMLPAAGAGIGVDPVRGKLFVSSVVGGELYRLDPSLRFLERVATGTRSNRFVVNANAAPGGKVYVLREDGNVVVVDATTLALRATHAVPGAQRVIAHPGTGFAYVIGDSPDLTIIDSADNAAFLGFGLTPPVVSAISLAIDTTLNRLFVGDVVLITQGRIAVYDIAGATPVRLGTALTGQVDGGKLTWSPVTQRLYVANGLTTTVTEFDPGTLSGATIVVGVRLEAGAHNAADGVSFVLDGAADRVAAVGLGGAPALIATTPVGRVPFRAEIAEARNEVYVVTQNGRTIDVLDARTGALLRTHSGLPNLTGGVAIDRTVAGGPKLYLSNPVIPPPTTVLPGRDWIQGYLPATDALQDINGNCFTTPCLGAIAIGTDEVAHRLYLSAIVIPDTTPSLAVYDTATDLFVRKVSFANAGMLPSFFLAVDPATSKIFLPVVSTSGARVVAVRDGASPTTVDIATAAAAVAFALSGARLYIAEPSAGQVEVVDTATSRVTGSIATGGGPAALFTQPPADLLWVANDGLPLPAVQIYSAAGPAQVLTDLGFLGFSRAFLGGASGRVAIANNLHGSVAVVDPALLGADLQIQARILPEGAPGLVYPMTPLTGAGGNGPHGWEITSGRLPPGLALDPSTGNISGTPSTEGIFSFMVRLTDQGQTPPRFDVEDFQIQILDLVLVTLDLGPAQECQPFVRTLVARGGGPPYTWAATGLPAWATLNPATGEISGLPTVPSSCPPLVQITVTDTVLRTATRSVCLGVDAAVMPVAIGNQLRAVRGANDVGLSWSYGQTIEGFNVYRSNGRGAPFNRIPPGGPLPPSAIIPSYTDFAAAPTPVYWYQTVAVNACGVESAE